jgi:hypothetical protein
MMRAIRYGSVVIGSYSPPITTDRFQYNILSINNQRRQVLALIQEQSQAIQPLLFALLITRR